MSAHPGGAPVPDEHATFDELAVGWALRALEPEDEAAFAVHLPTCPRCTRTVAETSEVMGALATDLPTAEPSDDLRRRLRAAVEETEQVHRPGSVPGAAADPPAGPGGDTGGADASRPTELGPQRAAAGHPAKRTLFRSGWRRAVPTALIAAAVAAILGLGIWNVSLSDSLARSRAAAAEQAEVVAALLAPGEARIAPLADHDGRDVATVVARDGQVQVVTHGLALNDAEDSVYVVWGMREGQPVALGTFDVVHSHLDVRTVGSEQTGLADFSGYGISLEPGRQPPATPTDVVASG